MTKINLKKEIKISGFVTENVPKGGTIVKLITRNSMTSDELSFYKYMVIKVDILSCFR